MYVKSVYTSTDIHNTRDESLLKNIWMNIRGKINDIAIILYYRPPNQLEEIDDFSPYFISHGVQEIHHCSNGGI